MVNNPPLRFSVCVETIFLEHPFEQRLEHVAAQGFNAFEFVERNRKDMNITQALASALRITPIAFVGSTASLVDPDQRAQFERDITQAASLAVDLSCANLIVHSGPLMPNVPRPQQHAHIVEALRKVVPIAEDAGVTLLLEPRNIYDYPGNYLIFSNQGFQIIREVNSPSVRLLFNLYHQQISEGNLSTRLVSNLDLIGHIHAADVPGRHEPGTGEINYRFIFALLREKGYRGYIGLDYTPLTSSERSLRAVRALAEPVK
ncbi:MAG: TIM barrel protein [Chloroflexaceae bacterium]|nr:TIM barrel protein [Chloroflexaceae bacterium]